MRAMQDVPTSAASSAPTADKLSLQQTIDDLLKRYLLLLNDYDIARKELSNSLSSVSVLL